MTYRDSIISFCIIFFFLFKIINNGLDCPDLTSRINLFVPTRSTRDRCLFKVDFYRNNYRAHATFPRLHLLGNEYSSVDIFNNDLFSFRCGIRELFRSANGFCKDRSDFVDTLYLVLYSCKCVRVRLCIDNVVHMFLFLFMYICI